MDSMVDDCFTLSDPCAPSLSDFRELPWCQQMTSNCRPLSMLVLRHKYVSSVIERHRLERSQCISATGQQSIRMKVFVKGYWQLEQIEHDDWITLNKVSQDFEIALKQIEAMPVFRQYL
jgi:hypothetical protein